MRATSSGRTFAADVYDGIDMRHLRVRGRQPVEPVAARVQLDTRASLAYTEAIEVMRRNPHLTSDEAAIVAVENLEVRLGRVLS